LRKDADLDVDGPLVIGNQRLHPFEAAHANGGIDFDLRAHAGGTLVDAVLQGALGARVHDLDRHALLPWGNAFLWTERFAVLRCATIDDPRFVKMNVGLDQPRTGEASLGVINLGLASESALEGDDTTLFHPDIDEVA